MKNGSASRLSRGKITYTVISFLSVLFIHFAYSVWQIIETARKWKQVNEVNPYWQYFERQEFFLGLSFALTAAFTAYTITNFIEKRRLGIAGTVGGLTLAGVLYFAGCFLTGCCGSPMLAVYLSLFGSSMLGFAKPLTAGLTAISVVVGFVWISKNNKTKVCSSNDVCCEVGEENSKRKIIMKKENNNTIDIEAVNKINSEMEEGIELLKCQQCGCMEETLEILKSDFPTEVDKWERKMIPIKYSCLGCAHCYPAVAMNLFNEALPEQANKKLECAFEVKEDKWPYVAGEYYAFCGRQTSESLPDSTSGDYCPVAVSTLGDTELAERLAKNHPKELCIVGKTETENIGIDKVIKNVITNPTIKYLLLVGQEPKGHKSGETFISLSQNGVDGKLRVVGSTAKKPILRNVSVEEINSFRNQVEVVNMIGCSDENLIVNKIKEIASKPKAYVSNSTFEKNKSTSKGTSCGCKECEEEISKAKEAEVIQAKEPSNIIMDKAGYFVILLIPEKNIINVEHYSYDNTLLSVIEGKDARSIYWTIIENKWVTFLSHAAYLGKELTKAELSLKNGFKYLQDGA